MKLAYRAYDKAGREVADTIEAPQAAEAAETLRRRGLFVIDIDQEGAEAIASAPSARAPGRTRRLKHLAVFSRQLYVLLSSGTQVVEALGALERQAREPAWREVIGRVRRDVEQGDALSEAMARAPAYFSPVCRAMVAAGEAGGRLVDMLQRQAALAESRLHVRRTIIGAMVYPCLLITLATGVLAVLMVFVIPRFAQLFDTLGVALPPSTQTMVALSEAFRGYWWAGAGALVALALTVRFWLNTPQGKRTIDTLVLAAPLFGRIARSFATARIVRLLGVLLQSNIPLLEALGLTREGTGNTHYAALIDRARDAVTQGEPVSAAFADDRLVSPSVREAIRSGEQTGQFGPLLINLADFLDDENEVVLRSLTAIIEPVILILMGLLVGVVALSLFMPLFDLTSMAGGGAA